MPNEYEQIMEWVRSKDPDFKNPKFKEVSGPFNPRFLIGPNELVICQDGLWNTTSPGRGISAGRGLAALKALYTPVPVEEQAKQLEAETLALTEEAKELDERRSRNYELRGNLAMLRQPYRSMEHPLAAMFYAKAALISKNPTRVAEMRVLWRKVIQSSVSSDQQ